MAKKVFLQDENKEELLPITRGELVLDSSGRMALHSDEFLASTSQPGLMSAEDKTKINNTKTDDSLSSTSVNPVQNKVVTAAINKAQTDASNAQNTADENKEELTKTQQIINSIKASYLKSASVSGNTLTIKDQGDSEIKFYNTTYGVVSSTTDGLAPKIGTSTSAVIGNQADEWVLTSTKGGTPTWRRLPFNAFLNDTSNTTYTLSGALNGNTFVNTLTPSSGSNTTSIVPAMTGATASAAGKAGLVPAPAAGDQGKVLSGAGTWISFPTLSISDTETTGNAITGITVSGHSITLKRGTSFSIQGHTHTTSDITSLSGYSKASAIAALTTSDTLNTALGKLEYKADQAYNWISSVTASDTDTYINKWGEIVDFLDSVAEGTDILDEFVTRKTAQTITATKTFNAGIQLYGITDYTNLPDSSYKFGKGSGLLHFRESDPTNYFGNAITWAYANSSEAQAGIYVTTGGSYGSEMWFATTDRFVDGPKASLKIDVHGNVHGIRGSFRGKFVTTNGSASQFVKGDGSLDSNTYITPSTFANYLPAHKAISFKNASNSTVTYNGFSALDLTGGIYYAVTANNTRYIQSPDTRATAYDINGMAAASNGVCFDFKQKSVSGLNEPYSGIMTYRPYGSSTDWSCGPAHQIAFDSSGLYHRKYNASGFTAWERLAYQSYINTTNFPGLNKVGTITGVTAGTGLSGGGTSGTVTLTNAGVRSTTINGNYLRVNTNGANSDLTIPYATRSSIVGDNTITLVPQNNEINIGGSSAGETIYIGYRATDSKPIPSKFIFGGSGIALLQAGGFIKNGSNDNYALMGGGGHKNISNVQNTAFYKRQASVNGTSYDLAGTVNTLATFTIYAPTAAGTSGQILASAGGTPTWRTPGNGLLVTANAIDLSASGVEEGTYGHTSSVVGNNEVKITLPEFTVDSYGRITEAINRTYTAKNYYPTTFSWTNGSTYGPTGSLTGTGMSAVSFAAIPSASSTVSGIVTTGAQTFAGEKTFASIRLRSNGTGISGGYLYFGDGSYAYLAELSDDKLTLNATTLYLGISGTQKYHIDGSTFRPVTANSSSTSGIALGATSYRFTYGYFAASVYAASGFYESSDERLKNILNPVKVNLDELSKLRKIYYTWKDNSESGVQLGVIAQDIQKIYPELVDVDSETGYLSLAYDKLSVIALEAIDTLYQDYKKLKERVDKLEKLLINKGIS